MIWIRDIRKIKFEVEVEVSQLVMQMHMHVQCKKNRKNIQRSHVQITSSFAVISDVYRSFIWNKTAFTKYCLTQWISKLPIRQ